MFIKYSTDARVYTLCIGMSNYVNNLRRDFLVLGIPFSCLINTGIEIIYNKRNDMIYLTIDRYMPIKIT